MSSIEMLVRSQLDRSESMLAAGTYLAVGEVQKAVSTLALNGEYDLAYCLLDVFSPTSKYDSTSGSGYMEAQLLSMARFVGDSGDLEAALDMISSSGAVGDATVESARLLCRYCEDEAYAARIAARWNYIIII